MRNRTDTGSTSTNQSLQRGRTWSSDITQTWNQTKAGANMTERLEAYRSFFTLGEGQLTHMLKRFGEEIDVGLQIHKDNPEHEWVLTNCSLKLLDTHVKKIPDGTEKGVAYALDFGGTNLRSVRVKLDGGGKVSLSHIKTSLKDSAPHHKKGLMDKEATAIELFDCFANQIRELMVKNNDISNTNWLGVGFTFSFPIMQESIKRANLLHWTKEFETGRGTNDRVEGADVCQLMDAAFWRQEVPVKTAAVLNDTTGTLLSCAYEKPRRSPPCLIGLILGTGVNGCYAQENASKYGYTGTVLNTELGCLDKGLPTTDIDLEVDFATGANRGYQLFEKMVSGAYLGEVARRFILKVFQKAAPEGAWLRESFPTECVAAVVNDNSKDHKTTREIMSGLWDWKVTEKELTIVRDVCTLVLDRSSGLAAVAVAAMSKKTGYLQRAMGGLTVGVDGSLYTQNPWYAKRMRAHLDTTLGAETASLIDIQVTSDGSGKGAAILAATLMN